MRRLLLTLIAFFVLTAPATAAWTWPVAGDVITPYRNGTDPYATGQHRGIDIAAPVGTAVVAAAGGEVRFAGTAGSSGLTISIRTSDGYDTSYLHLSAVGVRAGARVATGERIGEVGMTGVRSATAPHLHFGVRDAETRHAYHDPLAFLPPPTPPPHTPEPPLPAPAPAPEPAPPAAAPVTVPAPRAAPHSRPTPRVAPHRRPAPRGAPHRQPAPRPAPHSHPAPRPIPHRAPAPVTGPRGLPAPHPVPSPPRQSTRISRPRHLEAPGLRRARGLKAILDPGAGTPVTALRLDHDRASSAAAARDKPGGGPDIGWAAACAGLLLAAAILGLTNDGRRATVRTRSRLLAALSRG
jgi:hypothetical protein